MNVKIFKGGRHVDTVLEQIVKKLEEKVNAKNKGGLKVKTHQIKVRNFLHRNFLSVSYVIYFIIINIIYLNILFEQNFSKYNFSLIAGFSSMQESKIRRLTHRRRIPSHWSNQNSAQNQIYQINLLKRLRNPASCRSVLKFRIVRRILYKVINLSF